MNEIEAFDQATGEVYGLVPRSRRKRHPYGFDWHVVDNGALKSIYDRLHGKAEIRILFVLPMLMTEHNWILLTHHEIASKARVHRSAASRALRVLQDMDVVRPAGAGALRFNPMLAWRGSTAKLNGAIEAWRLARRSSS